MTTTNNTTADQLRALPCGQGDAATFAAQHGVSVATARKRLNALADTDAAFKLRLYSRRILASRFVYVLTTQENK